MADAESSSSSPSQYRIVGILLAIGSGVLIGTSFVFKKKGLLKSQAGHAAGEGVAYLKSVSGAISPLCAVRELIMRIFYLLANVVDWYDE